MKLSTIFDTLRSIWKTPIELIDLILAFFSLVIVGLSGWLLYLMLKDAPEYGIAFLVVPILTVIVAKVINYIAKW